MNIDIMKFYEIARSDEKQHLIGTLHIRLPEIGLNIKGITVFKKKKFWHFRLPSRKAYDPVLGKEIDYVCVLFDEGEKNETLISFLQTAGRQYIEKYLSQTPETSKGEAISKPLESINQENGMSRQEKIEDCEQESSNAILEKASPLKVKSKLAALEYRDPPKRSFVKKGKRINLH